jgi:hypothetical protein
MTVARVAGQGLARGLKELWPMAVKVGLPNLRDVGINAIPSLLYGGSMMTQGASPLEAVGTAGFDLGAQTILDTGFGVGGALAGGRFSKALQNRRLTRDMEGAANLGKMGSMVTMVLPNPVANAAYKRMENEALQAQGLASQGLLPSPSAAEPQRMPGAEDVDPRMLQAAAKFGVDPADLGDPMVEYYLRQLF